MDCNVLLVCDRAHILFFRNFIPFMIPVIITSIYGTMAHKLGARTGLFQ